MADIYSAEENGESRATDQGQMVGQPKREVKDEKEYSEVMRTERPTSNPLAAFCVRPRVVFESQDREEKVLLLLRKHIITNAGWLFLTLVLAFLPGLFGLFPPYEELPFNYQMVTIFAWYLVLFGFVLEQFLAWYFHVYIVTDERIFDYDFYSLIYKRVSVAKIDNIEDITYEMGGALRSLFNFGQVFIQTAGEARELDFEEVPKPEVVVKLLHELILEEEREKLEGRVR